MNLALKILNEKEFISHIILFKLYIDSKGRINKTYFGDIRKEIESLYDKNEFDIDIYNSSVSFLAMNKYTDRYSNCLKLRGVDYFENWLRNFENLSEDDKILLKKKLPKKIFDFFDFATKTTTVASFIELILKVSGKS